MNSNKTHEYRPEIDGLRALAVLPVMLFHANVPGFSGGYVGVDIFFVISGYLITSIIITEQKQNVFSLKSFYARRVRRILPALLLVTLSCVLVAPRLLTALEMQQFADSVISVLTFSANFHFWLDTSSYWSTASELKPLLHTWSLAVEEQFYIFFPLLMLLLAKTSANRRVLVIAVVTTLSLCICIFATPHYPSAAFYLLPTRAWELGAGVLIALTAQSPIISKLNRETASYTGLGLIAGSVFMFDRSTLFPGVAALVPVLGTSLLIIYARANTSIGKLLSQAWLVSLGLISYSAYLWHQPVLAFYRAQTQVEIEVPIALGLLTFSLLLAYLTWRFVEQPFRRKHNRYTLPAVSAAAVTAFALALMININSGNVLGKGDYSIEAAKARLKVNHGLHSTCEESFTLSKLCRTSDEPTIMVWGDSYAMHLVEAILSSNPEAKIIQMTKSVCGPAFDYAPVIPPIYDAGWAQGCIEFNDQVLTWLKQQNTIKYVVLGSPFNHHVDPNKQVMDRDGEHFYNSIAKATAMFSATLDRLVALGVKPVVFAPPPGNGSDLGRCLTRADWFEGSRTECDFPRSDMTEDRQMAYDMLVRLDADYQVVWLDEMMCDEEVCRSHFEDTYLYRDAGHLSIEGAKFLGRNYDFYGVVTGGHPR